MSIVPRFHTVFDKLYKYRPEQRVVMQLSLSYEELSTSTPLKELLLFKAKQYEQRATRHGYIVKVRRVISVGVGREDECGYKGDILYSAVLGVNIFNPKNGDVIYPATLLKKTTNGFTLKYGIHYVVIEPSDITDPQVYKIGEIFPIRVKHCQMHLDEHKYNIEYYVKRGDTHISKTLGVKNIISPIPIPSDPSYMVKYELFDGSMKSMKRKYITRINYNYPIVIYGKIFHLWTIPTNLRYVKLVSLGTPPVFDIKMVNDGTKVVYKYGLYARKDPKLFKNLQVELFESGYWAFMVSFYMYPYELIKGKYTYKPRGLNEMRTIYPHISSRIIARPVSRAYFKMFEISHMFQFHIPIVDDDLLVTIGDAPGGFAQALNHLYPKNKIITTSLRVWHNETTLKEEPIRYHQLVENAKNITIDYLTKRTGDLLDIDNIKDIISKYGRTCMIVGADGALSYVKDMEEFGTLKEVLHTKLLLSECCIALGLLKKGGSMCAKLFGRFTRTTTDIFYMMSKYFDEFYIYKPRMLRISNKEMFIVAKGLHTYPDFNGEIYPMLTTILTSPKYVMSMLALPPPNLFMVSMNKFNRTMEKIRLFIHELGYEIIRIEAPHFNSKHHTINLQLEYAKSLLSNFKDWTHPIHI